MDIRHITKLKKYDLSNEIHTAIDDLLMSYRVKGKATNCMFKFITDYLDNHKDHSSLIEDYHTYQGIKARNSKEKFYIRYGNIIGEDRWQQYRLKQSYSNTFEYKQEKLGWTRERYAIYMKSIRSGKDAFIERYGEEEGMRRQKAFVERQRDAGCSLRYFQEKYGEVDGKLKYEELNKKKKLNRVGFIRKYGEELGNRKWDEFCERKQKNNNGYFHSKTSQEMFNKLIEHIPEDKKYGVFYATKNYEYIFNHTTFNQCYFIDFFDSSCKKGIEFNGDYYHANPKIYAETFYNKKLKMDAPAIWERDKKKLDDIKQYYPDVDILVIWQKEWDDDPEKTVEKCLKFLGYEK